MKLYYSVTSPYSRKVLLLAKSLGMGNEVDIISANPLENDPAFMKLNPLGKVPALVQGGKTFIDSPYICEHLLRLAGQDRTGDAYMRRLEVQAMADGVMDAAVAMRMESVRTDAEPSDYWMGRWRSAIERALKHIEDNYLEELTGWKLDSIAVACMLDYLLFRLPAIEWQLAHPGLSAWFEEASKRKDIIETDPRRD